MIRSLRVAASPRALSAALAAFLAVPAIAHAAEAEATATDSSAVDQVIVIGRGDKPITVEPRGLSASLGQTEFEAINAANVEDLMKYAPNFFVRKRYIGDDNAVVGLRSANTVQSARTLVMVDGFVVSNFLGNRYDYPPKWNVVGPGEVRQFDIVYGPYSARYNGHSMGGVVSVTTRDPEGRDVYGTAQTFYQPYEQYGTSENYSGYSVEGGLSWKPENSPFSLRAGFRQLDSTGQPMSFYTLTASSGAATTVTGAKVDPLLPTPVFGAASPAHVVQTQFRVRTGLELDNGWTLDALAFSWLSENDQDEPQTYLRDASGNPVWSGKVRVDGVTYSASGVKLSTSERMEYLVGVKAAGPLAGWDASLNLSRYWIDRELAYASNSYATGIANGAGSLTDTRDSGWWTGAAVMERTLGAHAIAVGLDASLYSTDKINYTTTVWRQGDGRAFSSRTEGKTRFWGAFVEDEIALTDRLSITPGLRYDHWEAFDGALSGLAYDRRTDSAVSPKLSVQYDFESGWQAQLSLATSTRFPTVGELYQASLKPGVTPIEIDPESFDPNLKPEVSTDANLILRRTFGDVRLTGSLFWQEVEDSIYSFSGLNQNGLIRSGYKNVDLVRQYGLELIGEATDVFVPGLDIDFNIARVNAETVENRADPAAEGQAFPRIPDWRINGNARYEIRDGLKLSLGWRYASRPNSDLLGLKRGDTYSYISEFLLFDTRLTWDVTDAVQLGVGVDNIGNDKAWVSHPLPQRTFMVDLKLKM